jgi:hypothetical protein
MIWNENQFRDGEATVMRQASIETSMTCYIDQYAVATAAALYEAVGRTPNSKPADVTSGDTPANSDSANAVIPLQLNAATEFVK